MNKAMVWVKSHPYLTGAVVIVAGLAAYLIMSSRQSGGGQMVVSGAAGPSDSQIAASTQLQLAQMGAQVQLASIAAGANADVQGYQAQLALAQINAGYNHDALLVQQQLGMSQIEAQRDAQKQQTIGTILMSYLSSATTLGAIALSNPLKTTNSKQKSGFFGIGGGTTTSTSETSQHIDLPDIAAIIGQINGLNLTGSGNSNGNGGLLTGGG